MTPRVRRNRDLLARLQEDHVVAVGAIRLTIGSQVFDRDSVRVTSNNGRSKSSPGTNHLVSDTGSRPFVGEGDRHPDIVGRSDEMLLGLQLDLYFVLAAV
jgi:hypothetical protein